MEGADRKNTLEDREQKEAFATDRPARETLVAQKGDTKRRTPGRQKRGKSHHRRANQKELGSRKEKGRPSTRDRRDERTRRRGEQKPRSGNPSEGEKILVSNRICLYHRPRRTDKGLDIEAKKKKKQTTKKKKKKKTPGLVLLKTKISITPRDREKHPNRKIRR